MANMSYCRFENTLRDLQDCIWSLEDGEADNISGTELRSAIEMVTACREFLDLQWKLDSIVDHDTKYDNYD
tara:strand:- start:5 stop:217 length:213 start_codon:yes stop_codon:yes gene_type:complete